MSYHDLPLTIPLDKHIGELTGTPSSLAAVHPMTCTLSGDHRRRAVPTDIHGLDAHRVIIHGIPFGQVNKGHLFVQCAVIDGVDKIIGEDSI